MNITGTILDAKPNPAYVDETETPGVSPLVEVPRTAFMWLVETDTTTPEVYMIQVVDGELQPNSVVPGQYRMAFTYTEEEASATPVVVEVDGRKGTYVTRYPDAQYDAETGDLIDLGASASVFNPIVDPGGSGPCVHVHDADTGVLQDLIGPYTTPTTDSE